MGSKKNSTRISPYGSANIFNGIIEIGSSLIDVGKEVITSPQERYKRVQELNKSTEEQMNESVKEYERTYFILSNEIANLERITEELRSFFEDLGIPITTDNHKIEKTNQQAVSVEDNIAAESILKGTAVGSLASGSAVLLASSFGTAGTGAAISSLSGIYAILEIKKVLLSPKHTVSNL